MPDSMYADDEPGQKQEAPESDSPNKPAEETGMEGATFLVNKDVMPDLKPGDMITGKVVKVHDDQYECQAVKEGDEEKPSDDMAEMPEMAGAPEGGGGMYD